VRVAILLWAVRIGLWIIPFQRLHDLLTQTRLGSFIPHQQELAYTEKITTSVKRMRRFVLAATCLTQALVTEKLLHEAGLPAAMRIGVARSDAGKIEAHAWVESNGEVVIGGSHADLSRFTILHAVETT
jgi:Transglutaminase-like superfamily